jgi:hypothetical protein
LGVIFPLYGGEQGWMLLSLALQSAANGDGSVLLDMVDSYLEKKDDGTYSNIQEMNNAVNCLDRPTPDFAGVKAQADHFAMEAPRFGLPSLTSQLVCSHWAVQGPPVVVPKGQGAPPIVVVGTTHDPATPYAWAGALAMELESGVLLTNQGEGHTAYGRGSSCIDKAVETYLETQKPPTPGTTCDGATNVSMMMLRLPGMR